MEPIREEIQPSRLTYIDTELVHRNPHNPRALFDKQPMKILYDSIGEVGILVPLLVYQRGSDNEFVILDGERRWLCAMQLGLKKVPANIIEEPTPLRNLLTMFHIHNVREPWELMPTALKLEVIIRELKTDSEAKLSELTGLARANVRRCKYLLSYDKRYQDMMLNTDPDERVKPDFFIEMYPVSEMIKESLPEISLKYPGNELVDAFLRSYQERRLPNVLDFRKIATSIRGLNKGIIQRDYVLTNILNILGKENFLITDFVTAVDQAEGIQSFKKACISFTQKIVELNILNELKDQELIDTLIQLRAVIDEKIRLAQSR